MFLGFLPGHQHTYDPSSNLSNFPVQVLFLRFYLPGPRSARCGNHWNSRVLVYATVLEDRIEENGKAPSCYFPLKLAADMEVQFLVTCVTATVLSLWGMVGIWIDNFGWVVRVYSSLAEKMTFICTKSYHSSWEFWVYNAIFGLFQAPYFAFSQTVMADLCPPGFEFMVRAAFKLRYSAVTLSDVYGDCWEEYSSLACLDSRIAHRQLLGRM
jgi:hypothetical protein